jgi:transcriptional regulator of acetoin/glycerol metabolism
VSGTVNDSGSTNGDQNARSVPYLVLCLECDAPTSGGARYSLEGIDCITLGRGERRGATRHSDRGITTLDVRIASPATSTAHARIVRSGADWVIEDSGSTNGTFVNGLRVTRAVVHDRSTVGVGRVLFRIVSGRMTPEGAPSDIDVAAPSRDGGHVTLDPELDVELDALDRLARSDVSILIRGETGTGKELLARTIHERSARQGDFVAVNCGAIPSGLVESHLFGHVKGAFSGAVRDEPGLFRAADGGTLFLDEIGDLPLPSQAAVLRSLQEREVVPIGTTRPVKIALRVVSATHQPLEGMVEHGTFRRDLVARLSGFSIELPPLRARRIDLGIIVSSLLVKLAAARADKVRFTPAAGLALLRYDWPLNTRELEQCLARALVLAGEQPIDVVHLPTAVTAEIESVDVPPSSGVAPLSPRDAQLRIELLEQLALHRGNLADVARSMGKARMQLHRWCKRFGIDPNLYRG